ncbi:MAG: hypothetical protein SH818_14265 [Saprospiraceae bacterium]|nr:hypothetical protein [Saprospiraceae bacterium]
MKLDIQKSFEKDIEEISDVKLASQMLILIQKLENCKALSEIQHLMKLKAKGSYFRIRIGNFRLGLKQEKDTLTLLRFLHRKVIYKHFP